MLIRELLAEILTGYGYKKGKGGNYLQTNGKVTCIVHPTRSAHSPHGEYFLDIGAMHADAPGGSDASQIADGRWHVSARGEALLGRDPMLLKALKEDSDLADSERRSILASAIGELNDKYLSVWLDEANLLALARAKWNPDIPVRGSIQEYAASKTEGDAGDLK